MADLVTIATEQPTIAMVAKQNPKGYADTIASIVSETIQVSGRKDITDADKAFLILKTKEEIEEEYKFLTGSEVRFAFKQGVRGRYGDYYHISLPTFVKWLDKYLESDERQRVVDSRQKVIPVQYRLEQRNKISERDTAEVFRQRADYCYKVYLETGKIPLSNANYKNLNSLLEGYTIEQMRKDGKARKEEKTFEQIFIRHKRDGKKSIY